MEVERIMGRHGIRTPGFVRIHTFFHQFFFMLFEGTCMTGNVLSWRPGCCKVINIKVSFLCKKAASCCVWEHN